MRHLAAISLFLAMLSSCQLVKSIIHDDEVAAKVGSNVLYKSEVESLIPEGTTGEDSLRIAMQYINAWGSDMVFLDMAESKLSKSEKDVTKELESYRRSLLKYRYEQHYVNERLDTTVTEAEIEEYYNSHKESFILASPIVKARFLRISPTSPNLKQMKKLMSDTGEDALWEAENLAYSSSDVFTGYANNWIDIRKLAEDMGSDKEHLLGIGPDKFVEINDGKGSVSIAYIIELIDAGNLAPVEYCAPEISDIIISTRKRRLTASLEQELLNSARSKGKFVIY